MKKDSQVPKHESFSEFLKDPPIALSLYVLALIALFLAILEFSKAVYY